MWGAHPVGMNLVDFSLKIWHVHVGPVASESRTRIWHTFALVESPKQFIPHPTSPYFYEKFGRITTPTFSESGEVCTPSPPVAPLQVNAAIWCYVSIVPIYVCMLMQTTRMISWRILHWFTSVHDKASSPELLYFLYSISTSRQKL